MTNKPFRLIASLAVCGLLIGLMPAAPALAGAGAPPNYSAQKGLSQARFDTVRESAEIEMKDGTLIYVEVVRPKTSGKFPVILELSPYHGTLADRSGTRILPGPKGKDNKPIGLAGYFAPRGYAVVFADLRGTGRSTGCLDHLGPKDQSDSLEILKWSATQKWSTGKVGMTGHSYVGSTPQMTAAQKGAEKWLKTIVPSAGLGSMYHHEFQDGVPYFLQWAGPLEAYEQLAMERYLPVDVPTLPLVGDLVHGGDNGLNNPQYFGCGWTQSAAVTGEAYFSGAYTEWHAERDFAKGATKADIPVFNVHGVNDNAARTPGMDWFNDRIRPGDKAWIGQWDHGSSRFPNDRTCLQTEAKQCEDDEWTTALHAWFDEHLMGKNLNTGPALEAFLNTGDIFTSSQWPPKVDEQVKFYPKADGSMTTSPVGVDAGSNSYVSDGRATGSLTGQGQEMQTAGVNFVTDKLTKDTLVIGIPKLRLVSSVVGGRVHINVQMYDVDPDGTPDLMGKAGFAIQPELRDGLDNPKPVIPGEKMEIDLEGMAQAHMIKKGHRLMLRVTGSHPDKVATFGNGPHVTVYSGGKDGTVLTLPVIYNPRLYDDPRSLI